MYDKNTSVLKSISHKNFIIRSNLSDLCLQQKNPSEKLLEIELYFTKYRIQSKFLDSLWPLNCAEFQNWSSRRYKLSSEIFWNLAQQTPQYSELSNKRTHTSTSGTSDENEKVLGKFLVRLWRAKKGVPKFFACAGLFFRCGGNKNCYKTIKTI